MAQHVIIFGTGDLGQLVYSYLVDDPAFEPVGFVLDREYIKDDSFMGLPVVPYDVIETKFPPNRCKMFIAIGYRQMNANRKSKYADAKEKGYSFINLVHPSAIISSHARLGDNCMVLEGAIVQPYVTIGDGVFLWSGAHIGHHSQIEDFSFFAPRVAVSGFVRIGSRTFVGINATIRDGVKVGLECVIGAGVTLLEDLPDYSVVKAPFPQHLEISSNQLRNL